MPWPDREPFLGYYAEEDIKVAEQHIEWASQYGITFFAYDWYWDGKSTSLYHAIDNYIKASNNSKIKFSILWANHSDIPRSLKEFDDMVNFWLMHYLGHPQYYRINGKPTVFIFSNGRLEANAKKFGWSVKRLLVRADEMARNSGLPGIFFIATNNAKPSDELETNLAEQGFSAYSSFNYVQSKGKVKLADYQSMVDIYLDFYKAASKTKGTLPYIVPASPGWDDRPWHRTTVRTDSTPTKFKQMLIGAKHLIDSNKASVLNVVMIESWNEFGEGAYIEPTKKWGYEYLKVIREAFGKPPPVKKNVTKQNKDMPRQ